MLKRTGLLRIIATTSSRLTCLLIALGSAGIGLADDAALEDRDWQLFSSDNFRVHSVLKEARTVELIRQLEAMQVALGQMAMRLGQHDAALHLLQTTILIR